MSELTLEHSRNPGIMLVLLSHLGRMGLSDTARWLALSLVLAGADAPESHQGVAG
jgi:hypothetical protein